MIDVLTLVVIIAGAVSCFGMLVRYSLYANWRNPIAWWIIGLNVGWGLLAGGSAIRRITPSPLDSELIGFILIVLAVLPLLTQHLIFNYARRSSSHNRLKDRPLGSLLDTQQRIYDEIKRRANKT